MSSDISSAGPQVDDSYRYRPGNDRVARQFLTDLFGTYETLDWVTEVRRDAIGGALVVTPDQQSGVPILPAMLGSAQPRMRDAACSSITSILYDNDIADVRQSFSEAGLREYNPALGTARPPSPYYILLDTGEARTNGGVSMQEGVMVVDESLTPPRVTVIYRGTKDAEDMRSHVDGAIDYARGRTIDTYRDDYGLRLNADGSYSALEGEQLVDQTHPLIRAEIDRLRTTHGDTIGVTFYGHSLGADPAARDAAFFSTEYDNLTIDYVGAAPISSFTSEERALLSQQIRGREFEVYNADDPLTRASNFFRQFNRMDSLGSGSNDDIPLDQRVLQIEVPGGHNYGDSIFLEALREAALARRLEPAPRGGEAWFCQFMANFDPEVPAIQRAEAMRQFIEEELGAVNQTYCGQQNPLARAYAQYASGYQPPSRDDEDSRVQLTALAVRSTTEVQVS